MPRFSNLRFRQKGEKKISFKIFFKFLSNFQISKSVWIFTVLFGLLVASLTNIASWLMGFITDKFLDPKTFNLANFKMKDYIVFVVMLALVYVFIKIFEISQRVIVSKLSARLGRNLRLQCYQKIQQMEMSFYEEEQTGDLMSALTNDIQNITEAIWDILISVISIIFEFSFITIMMFIYVPLLAAIILAIVPINASVIFLIIRSNQKFYIQQQERLGEFNGYLEEIMDAFPLVNLHQQKENVAKEFDKYSRALIKPDASATTRMNIVFPWFHFSKTINLIIVIAASAAFVYYKVPTGGIKPLSAGVVMSFTLYLFRISDNISLLLEVINGIQHGLGSIVRINKILALVPQFDEVKLNELDYKTGKIEFKNVSFAYASKPDKLVLKNISFTIEKGKSLALVGHTGCGKTTIAKLLSKFYVPTSGDILIDGQSILKTKSKSWRNYIDTILQETYIFNDTVKNNLTVVNPNISDKDFNDIVEKTSVAEFINLMPEKFDTVLKSNGANLSEGQKQLIAISRSLIASKPISILDEATSNIDTITELKVQHAMKYLMKDRSMLIIAHRLSTIKNVDEILVINEGEIIERGNHDQLMKQNGHYKKIYSLGLNDTKID
ncbi:ABC-type multidrug/protein/lipid transport system ATPase component (plasmid) [Mesomycoplasma conjunctivae]|uniref:ABC transporter ATP binding protein n=2 Tax=Mycoplasmopsis fermentans TaxID=2115 RepID=A0AB32XCI1_MYCFM|nr:ABC transporter ATP-binding protein [Mycoplasmopsis fermentans]ADV34561.1 ABC transporter ATP binding protein [Mycoplasmopsis fermentans M64]VEU64116.1 ABC-type multidrug/protein/lipid transport system ATPase component [Mycoplasmopsis fermentans]VEU66755.1 ABC-type multidrug/protein/lipid transport system ATPase component [Mesomycoplasma conjunctivae]